MFIKTYLSPSVFSEKKCMNVCMIMQQEWRKHGEVKSIMLGSRVTTPFGKDYGFICTCISGSTKFPKFSTTSEYLSGYGTTPGPTIFVAKSRLGVVSRNNQFKTTLD